HNAEDDELLFLFRARSSPTTSPGIGGRIGGHLSGIKANEINPRIVRHYGIPSGSQSLAYDSIQKILAISTK
ncbi:hypothetical protein GIB67_026820, partial [Kingdonia uniflora]